jgi:hypothetical protein
MLGLSAKCTSILWAIALSKKEQNMNSKSPTYFINIKLI